MTTVIRAVLWDFGGVLTSSPFDAFRRYEEANGLPSDFLRRLNAVNPDTNAWSLFERGLIEVEVFAARFAEEASLAGGVVDARDLLSSLSGEVRPAMVEAVRRCHDRLKTGLLTNNFMIGHATVDFGSILDHFDVVIESSRVGVRKPEPRFYETACVALGIEPDEAVFLDDLGVNLKPARNMGMQTIKVVEPAAALDELEEIVGFPLR